LEKYDHYNETQLNRLPDTKEYKAVEDHTLQYDMLLAFRF